MFRFYWATPVPVSSAAVHAGRVGAQNGVVVRAVEAMLDVGAHAEDISVLLGPSVSGRNYEVPAAMAAEVEATLPGSRTTTAKRTPGLDLRAGIARQLTGLGITAIDVDPRCTVEDPQPVQSPARCSDGTAGVAGVDGMTGTVATTRELELADALTAVRARLTAAAEAAGRNENEIELLPITKFFPAADVSILHRLGCDRFRRIARTGSVE